MTNPFNPLNPMNNSCYTEYEYPGTIDEVVRYYDSMPAVNPNGPKLRPQPTKDSWYYSKDNADDGKISPFEKLKAFVKGGTYNMIKGLFCDKDGFSLSRTLTTAALGTAIYFTGPIGIAIAGGVGLFAAIDNFAQSVRLAKSATTDQGAREAYEGFGESTSTAGLSLFGGYKGINAIKNNFAWVKAHPNMKVPFFDNFIKWDVSKFAKLRPVKPSTDEKPPIVENPPVEEPPIKNPETLTEETSIDTSITEETSIDTAITEETTITEEAATVVEDSPKVPKKKAVKKPRKKSVSKKPKKVRVPKLKGFDGDARKINIQIPKDVEFFAETSPTLKNPDPIGYPTSDMWY